MNDRRPTKRVTREDSRDENTRLILQTIAEHQPTSRADLARATGLSRASVSDHVAALLRAGLVAELGTGYSEGGKPPTLLGMRRDGRTVIAVDLSRQPFQVAEVDLAGTVRARLLAPAVGLVGGDALRTIAEMITSLLDAAESPVLGIGVSCPGIVDQEGRVRQAANLEWKDLDLGRILEDRFSCSLVVANDANASALAELGKLRDTGIDSLLTLRVSDGVGSGIVLNGELFLGHTFAAGEVGHVKIDSLDSMCRCGKRGCLETAVSARSILRQAGVDVPEAAVMSSEQVMRTLAEVADAPPMEQAGRIVGRLLGVLITALDIPTIRIGGEIVGAGPRFIEVVREEVLDAVLPVLLPSVSVEYGTTEPDAALHGAFGLVVRSQLGIQPPSTSSALDQERIFRTRAIPRSVTSS